MKPRFEFWKFKQTNTRLLGIGYDADDGIVYVGFWKYVLQINLAKARLVEQSHAD